MYALIQAMELLGPDLFLEYLRQVKAHGAEFVLNRGLELSQRHPEGLTKEAENEYMGLSLLFGLAANHYGNGDPHWPGLEGNKPDEA